MKSLVLCMLLSLFSVSVFGNNECPLTSNTGENEVLIGWLTDVRETTSMNTGVTTKVGDFRPVALLKGTLLTETTGAIIENGQKFWPVLDLSKPVKLASVESFLDEMGEEHCIYYASVTGPRHKVWTLFASKPLEGLFRAPTKRDRTEFARNITTCIDQGDPPEEKIPPCSRPKLLAVTDINGDGQPEYWATEPYKWDTGLTVWKNENGKFVELLQVCVGCSD